MSFVDPYSHTASIQVEVPAERARAFMADGLEQTYWALGSLDRRQLEPDLYVGNSSFSGDELYIRIKTDPELLLVDYFVGPAPDDLRHLVEARIQPGPNVGLTDEQSVITMTAWRCGDSDEDWLREYWVWRTEVHLIKARLEGRRKA